MRRRASGGFDCACAYVLAMVPSILLALAVIILSTPGGPPFKSWASFVLALVALLMVVVGWPRIS